MCFLDQALCGAEGRGAAADDGVGVDEQEEEAEDAEAGTGDGVEDGAEPGDWGIDTDNGDEKTGGVCVLLGSEELVFSSPDRVEPADIGMLDGAGMVDVFMSDLEPPFVLWNKGAEDTLPLLSLIKDRPSNFM